MLKRLTFFTVTVGILLLLLGVAFQAKRVDAGYLPDKQPNYLSLSKLGSIKLGPIKVGSIETQTAMTTPILALYVLAFDNAPDSPHGLTSYYTPTLQGIVSATAAMTNRIAVILADLAGYGDTHLLIAQGGVLSQTEGLPRFETGTLQLILDPTLREADTANGEVLGRFIQWARQQYPAQQTLFSFVGHGVALAPKLLPQPATIPEMTPTPAPTLPIPQDAPLPLRWHAHVDLTDYHSASLITIHDLADALALGSNGGANPLTVVDLLHCFSASIEELYQLRPYAQTMIAAPNYTYADSAMFGAALAAVRPSDSPQQAAQRMAATYDTILPLEEHPRLTVVVDAAKMTAIKNAWDQTSQALLQSINNDEAGAKEKIRQAYRQSAKYDTTLCYPQDWTLTPPDALSDMADFADQLRLSFGVTSTVGSWALTTTQAISDAIVARYAHDGQPWFVPPPIDGSPVATWTLHAPGISLFTDFVPLMPTGIPDFSWQARWYTGVTNPEARPYAFLQAEQGATWGDLFRRFWQGTSIRSAKEHCTLGFVTGRGQGELAILALEPVSIITRTQPITATFIQFAATIQSAETATNPLVRFRVYPSKQGQNVPDIAPLDEVVIGSGYLEAGTTHRVQTNGYWRADSPGTYWVEAMVDADQRFNEANEQNNIFTTTVQVITPSIQIHLPWVRR